VTSSRNFPAAASNEDCAPAPLSAREEAAAFLGAIIASSDDAIVSKDLNGIITSWNPAAERMFGYSEQEAVGSSIVMIIPFERLHEEEEVLRRVRRGERVDHFETVRRRKDGSLIDISLTVSPIRDARDRIIGASKVARDISERKAAEAAERRWAATRDEFLSLVSHELRTPIAIIVGNGHLLLRRESTLSEADRLQALIDVTAEGERLQRIIENLLLLTRVEAGEDIELEYLQLDRLVEQVVSSVQRRAPEREISFERVGALPPVMGEPTLVTLVIENLLTNAIKYSPAGQPIEVTACPSEDGGAVIHVLDRGIGLSQEDLATIFEPFQRGAAAKERASGMGLGLAVCQKVVAEQRGRIGGHPRPGGGADFWFSLPAGPEALFA
jgi:PAS domain S-box-containing protein